MDVEVGNMSDSNALDERILPIVQACGPLRVAVKMECVEDRYYIHFDGSKTYPEKDGWDRYWMGFNAYVKHLLRSNGFDDKDVEMKGPCHAVAFVGTLFGFLVREIKHDE